MMQTAPALEPAARVTVAGGVTTTRSNRIWLDDEGIIHIEALPDRDQVLADAEETIAVVWEVGAREKRRIVVDPRRMRSISREARAFFAGSVPKAHGIATALLVDSPLSRIMGNVFLGFNKPLLPARLFTSEGEALAWLRTLVA
jgi:hypothetical protein